MFQLYTSGRRVIPKEIKPSLKQRTTANGGVAEEASHLNKEMKIKDKKIKTLEKDLQRKDKALAETASILVLRKKLNTLLGTEEIGLLLIKYD